MNVDTVTNSHLNVLIKTQFELHSSVGGTST